MATGDTVNGDILVKKRDNSDNEYKVVGRLSSGELDTFGVDDPQGKVFVNTARAQNADDPPAGARKVNAPAAYFSQGEQIKIAFVPSESPANALDVSGDQSQLRLRVVRVDLNTGIPNAETLSLTSNEIGSDPSLTAGEEVIWYQETVGNQTRVFQAGLFEAAPSEA